MADMPQTLLIRNQVNNPTPADCISKLPDDILAFILSFLSMRDAVKARTLSCRWRNLSASMPDLNFDLLSMLDINYKEIYLSQNSHIFRDKTCRFVAGVNQFLQLHRLAKINSFRVWFCLGNESACHLDRWISLAITMGTEKLNLNLSSIPQNSELYNFPFHFLPHGNTSPLKHLCLVSCILRPSPNTIDCFNSLKTLDLTDVPLDQNCLMSIFTGCVNLEWFRLERCSLPVNLFICNQLLRLKVLIVESCEVENIEISSVNLTTFEYIGTVKNFRFAGVPWLEKVYFKFLHAFERGTNYMFNELPNNLPQLRILSLFLLSWQVGPIPAAVSMTRFNNLKKLELIVAVSTDFDLLSLTSIINASPILEKFHLALHSGSQRGPRRADEYLRHPHLQLKTIEISGFPDRWNAMALAKYLLNNSIALEKFIVYSVWETYHGCNRWSSRCQFPPMNASERERVQSLLLKEKVNPRAEVYVK